MRFSFLLAAAALVAGVPAQGSPATRDQTSDALGFTAANDYGAPIPPWQPDNQPGWYYGVGPPPAGLSVVLDSVFCLLLELLLGFHCPAPPPHQPQPEYAQTFKNLTCASQDNSYQTFGLVDTVGDCQAMCDSITGCTFVNSYHDVNGKDGSPLLTCSLFTECLTASTADNCGGQTQADGSVDFIINSDGYCKKTPTA
ncbi:hypothetical protein B0H16DRAFT_1605005 [Mycena metata]|uniref:Fruit-body specific protein a n=1 Tax=Mycena metata TaxID=1033252 RepID=A0AAD7MJX2_9AGAR|nr:hypothetical protein B0H16DRAFT_1605005 [Mycena metata]